MLISHLFLAYTGLTTSLAAPIATSPTPDLLPKPTGIYQVGRSVTELIDTSRKQPFVPDAEPIRLMISVFYPVLPGQPSSTGAYFPPETAEIEDGELSSDGIAAPNGTFDKLLLNLADDTPKDEAEKFVLDIAKDALHLESCEFPLVIFMPGEGTTRLFYQQIVSTVASKGYIVVAIDAPHDVDVVEYPDGSIATMNATAWNESDITTLQKSGYLGIKSRVGDVSFVLDSLSNATLAHSLVPNLPSPGLNTSFTVMFGHSVGGSTAFSILGVDDRVKGGLDMDGGLFGPGLDTGTDKPFMLMGSANHTRENIDDDPFLTWETAWKHLGGWKRDVMVTGAMHYDFSDYPIVFETLGITPNETIGESIGVLIGPLGGTRALDIVTTYVGAFLDFVITGTSSALLNGPVKEFPEVIFEN